jgi:manganese oxidase
MFRRMRIIRSVILVLFLAGLAVVPASAQTTPNDSTASQAGTVVYNIFATDAFIKMADGTVVYNYGFVGGREGSTLIYEQSVGIDGSVTGNAQIPGGAPRPQAGPLSDTERQLQGNAQFPAPLIYASVGDVVQINFKNLGVAANLAANPATPNDPHSIHLHGLDVNAANDGVPETSVGAVPANLCDDGTSAPQGQNCADVGKTQAPGAGNVIVYMFKPTYPGTYMYHCHQEADIHVQMGMYGALVIYNRSDAAASTGPGAGKGGTLFGWSYDKDYVLLESEIDVRQHCSEQGTYDTDPNYPRQCPGFPSVPGQPNSITLSDGTVVGIGYNPVDYDPQYWLLNGLSFPDTIHLGGGGAYDTWDNWIAAHPGYDPLISGSVSTTHREYRIGKGDKVLIRMINMGFETQPMHMHGYHGKILGSDQRAWPWANLPFLTPFGLGEEKQTLTMGSGETYEWLVDFGQQSITSNYPNGNGGLNGNFSGGTQTRYDPNTNLPVSNTTSNPEIFNPGEPPYIGGPKVSGAIVARSITSQLFPFHNHDDYKATNNGAYPGGMFTFLVPLP